MINLKKVFLTIAALFGAVSLWAQMGSSPVTWTASTRHLEGKTYEVVLEAKISGDWHMYDFGPYDGGPNPTTVTLGKATGATFTGKPYMIDKAKRQMDEMFGMEIGYYVGKARFGQKVTLTAEKATVTGNVEWMVCNDQNCMPPDDWDFSVEITANDAAKAALSGAAKPAETAAATAALTTEPTPTEEPAVAEDSTATIAATDAPATAQEAAVGTPVHEEASIWSNIIQAILWGLVALITPCVFPMIPMTVSFFMKGSENKAAGRFKAIMYGVFIVALYTLPIFILILISNTIGSEAVTADIFNWIATHWLPNIIFFLVFIFFAASFFGAFEITLPSWMVNKSDEKADKGGLIGVFFMALTLVLVSFSCTGPLVGTAIVNSTTAGGSIWNPVFTMLAFSTTFAIPFALFALFPSLLTNMKSGGWLNSVKVVLGFIEVALGLKFLSVADQAYHWRLLDRELYLAIWIVCAFLLGLYLLGKLKFSHDSDVKHISVPRLFLAICSFTFGVLLIPGLWGAPLKNLSGYLPPLSTQTFVLGGESGSVSHNAPNPLAGENIKYADFLHLPEGFHGFFDYTQGMAYAKKVNKPVMIDYTGHACTNCREMENRVWTDPEVKRIINEEYVLIALYGDDKTELPESEWVTDDHGKVRKTLGKINAEFALKQYGVAAMPYYMLLDHEGKLLIPNPYSYDRDIAKFIKYLNDGVAAFKAKK